MPTFAVPAASPTDRPQELTHKLSLGSGAEIPAELTRSVWEAFDRAIEQTKTTFSATLTTDVGPFIDSVSDSVRCVIVGVEPHPIAPAASVSTSQVLESVRRNFVDEVHARSAADAQQAIHILSALGRVQCILDLAVPEQTPDLLAGRDAAGLLIEIAHDMRSPLAAILFLLDMLRSERCGTVNARQQQQLRLIYGASLGMMQMACDMIDSVRGAERLVGETPADFSITDMLNSVRDIVQPMAEEKGVDVELVFPAEDARVGLPAVVTRILLNLTSNAIKFSNSGVVTVAAVPAAGVDAVRFSVQDSGREIPPAVMEQLFKPFRHSDVRRARTFSSAGLGLSICHKLVLALGSDLCVTTSANRGTCFHFVLELPVAGKK